MSLEKYLEKRDLTRTPEPGPKQRKLEKVLRFVVQKHAASHLHYDFRLELDGVLKSWAIPKGPSLDPSIRRLAMMVEDHPYDYRNFEGIIPKGNYGAGEVMVWDEGTYHAVGSADGRKSEELLREGLRKGDLKFVLEGQKLNGEFALVRMRTEKENTWLLIKKHDDYATTEEITLQDRSVISNATLQEIKEGTVPPPRSVTPPVETAPEELPPESPPEATAAKAAPKTGRAAEAAAEERAPESGETEERGTDPMPHNVRPMLASSAADPFDDPDWIFEIKLDGYRCIAEIESGNVSIYSRNNLSFNNRFPNIVRSLESIRRDAVFDGEVAALDESGRSSFQLLQNHQRTGEGNIVLYLFDVLYLDGRDLSRLPLLTRKEILRDLLPDLPNIRYSDHIAGYGKDFFDLAQKNSLEGIIAKRSTSQYLAGRRTRDWLKIKIRMQQEAVICGFTAPRGSRKKFGSLVLGVYENNELVYIGLTGGGFDDAGLQDMYRQLEPLVQPHSPFKEKIKTDTPVKWVKPELVCEITFSEWTEERIMRQPIFLGLREDKDPKQVVRELFQGELEGSPAEEPELAEEPDQENAPEPERRGKSKNMVLVIDGKRLELSNLEKVFWPEEGYTKGDVIDYYRKVAHIILPHLQDRPESLYRTPHGITGKGFFQKEAGELPPPWMTTKEIYSKHVDKDIRFFVCQDEATLIYMANLGCIEINPWLSRIQSLNYPDYFVIDLDPEDIGFDKVIETALAVHEVLERAGAASYPKTSGATGIHIFVPLGAKYDYETAERFAKILVTLVHHKIPEFTSLLRSPSKRQKKVYLDFLQNKAGQTLAAPYSIRPKPGATVSTPLRWEEVKPGLHPSQFNIRNMLERIEHVGDLFSGVLGPGIDIEKCLENLENSD